MKLSIWYGWPADYRGLTWFFWRWDFSQSHENGATRYTGVRLFGWSFELRHGPLSDFDKSFIDRKDCNGPKDGA
jgi:hypothetical protein